MTRNNDGFFGGSSGFIILILFLLMMNGSWGGFGGYGGANAIATQGALTRAELYDGLNAQNTFSEFREVERTLDNGFAGINTSLCAGFGGVQSAIADSNYRMADCCCAIKNTIHDESEKTRALIQANTIQELRDELQDAKNENLATGLVTAQGIQTQNLEEFMRRLVSGCGCNA